MNQAVFAEKAVKQYKRFRTQNIPKKCGESRGNEEFSYYHALAGSIMWLSVRTSHDVANERTLRLFATYL